MGIQTSIRGKVTVIRIIGNLDSNTSIQIEEEIMKFVVNNCCLVVDMSECSYISSAGLRVLMSIGKQLQVNNGCWAFAGLSDEIIDIMNMTGFANFFKIYSTIDEAVKSIEV